MLRKTVIFFLVFGVCFVAELVVGSHDTWSVIWVLFAAVFMKSTVLELQMSVRRLFADHLRAESEAHGYMTEPGWLSHGLSMASAIIITLGFGTILKGVFLSHGASWTLALLTVVMLLLFRFLKVTPTSNGAPTGKAGSYGLIKDNLSDSAVAYGRLGAILVVSVLAVNLAASFLLNPKDTIVFVTQEVNIANFDQVALESAVELNDKNAYSRAVINSYVLGDTFRLALANTLFTELLPGQAKDQLYYVFFCLIWLFNFIKLLPFSTGLVLLVRGIMYLVDRAAQAIRPDRQSGGNWMNKDQESAPEVAG